MCDKIVILPFARNWDTDFLHWYRDFLIFCFKLMSRKKVWISFRKSQNDMGEMIIQCAIRVTGAPDPLLWPLPTATPQ